jgi:hypothetical protein
MTEPMPAPEPTPAVRPFYERPLVYVAAPYSTGDPVHNTHLAIRVGDELNDTGLVAAYVPHLSLLWHIVSPKDVDHWYEHDLAILSRCDALFRVEGASKGADQEQDFADANRIPVFFEIHELLDWARRQL